MKTFHQKLLIVFLFNLVFNSIHAQYKMDDFTIKVNDENLKLEEVISRYIQFPSISGQEKDAGEWLKNICIENGLHVTQMGNEDGNYNFTASILPLELNFQNIIFLNHIDVVPVYDSSIWEHPPFSGHITQDHIWGRGSFDNKGAAIMHLFSILKFKELYNSILPNVNVSMLSVSCEETQCDGGIKYVVENYLEVLNAAVVIGEGPSELSSILKSDELVFGISVAHKRPLWLELKLSFESIGHASVTPETYPIKEMTTALDKLMSKQQDIKFNRITKNLFKTLSTFKKGPASFMLKRPKFFLPLLKKQICSQPEILALFSNSITVTSIESKGHAINVIPQEIRVTLDCRLQIDQNINHFLSKMKKALDNDKIDINILKSGPKTIVSDTENDFYHTLSNSIQSIYPNSRVIPACLPVCNDTGIFRSHGIPSYCINPYTLTREELECVHSDNERIPRKQLNKAASVYLSFILNCNNNSNPLTDYK